MGNMSIHQVKASDHRVSAGDNDAGSTLSSRSLVFWGMPNCQHT